VRRLFLVCALVLVAPGAASAEDGQTGASPLVRSAATVRRGRGTARRRPPRDLLRPPSSRELLRLGLARLEAGDYDQALRGFEGASRASSAQTRRLAALNRGIALLRLSRFDQAEKALVEVAATFTAGRADALLAAALAAVNGQALERAAGYLDRAGAADAGGALASSIDQVRAVVAEKIKEAAGRDLERERWQPARDRYRLVSRLASLRQAPPAERAQLQATLGYLDFKLQDYDDARARFAAAQALAPDDGDTRYMLARADLETGDVEAAAHGFEAALDTPLDGEKRKSARRRIDALSAGLRSQGPGWSARVDALGGFDTDAVQSGLLVDRTNGQAGASGFATIAAGITRGFELGPRTFLQAAFDVEQLAYSRPGFERFDLQVHTLAVAGEARRGRWRLLLPVEGAQVFAGLRSFAALQRSLTVRPGLALDESLHSATALNFEWSDKASPSAALRAFGGRRLELGLEQTLRRRPGDGDALGLRLFLRREQLGEEIVASADDPACDQRCFRTPLGYREAGLFLFGSWRSQAGVRFAATAGLEWRRYDGQTPLGHLEPGGFVADLWPGRTRADLRFAPSASIEVPLRSDLDLVLRYDLVVNRSNVQRTAPGHATDFDDKNFVKETMGAGLSAHW
jgi:Tfp pilus assembly protein PilF